MQSYNVVHRNHHRGVVAAPSNGVMPPAPVMSSSIQIQHQPPTPPQRSKDDLELMLYHERFPQLLSTAHKVKQIHCLLHQQGLNQHRNNSNDNNNNQSLPLPPSQVMSAVSRIQNQFTGNANRAVVRAGQSPLTDLMINDCIDTLQQELAACEAYLPSTKSSSEAAKTKTAEAGGGKKKKKKKNSSGKKAIAIKYDKWQTDILMQWMIDHKERPFPDSEQIADLMKRTNLTNSQVVNWATNVRKRNRKATLDGTKEPHHFIDFVFLAHEQYKLKQAKATTAVTNDRDASSTPPVTDEYSDGSLDLNIGDDDDDNDNAATNNNRYHSPMPNVSPTNRMAPFATTTGTSMEQPSPITSSSRFGQQPQGGPNTVSPLTDVEAGAVSASSKKQSSASYPHFPGSSEDDDDDDLGSDVDLDFDPISMEKNDDDIMLEEFAENWLGPPPPTTTTLCHDAPLMPSDSTDDDYYNYFGGGHDDDDDDEMMLPSKRSRQLDDGSAFCML